MNKLCVLAIGCTLVGITPGLMPAQAQQRQGAVLIAGDRPVTGEQVLARLKSDGWSDIVISTEGRYLQVTGTLNGQIGKIAVDSQTGRLRASDHYDDDDDY
jgi:hypothetical protein